MSNFEAIAAVTETLRGRLASAIGLSGAVMTEPLDKLAGHGINPALNLHLYQILPNANWRNMDIPWKVKPGEVGRAALALDLRYLLTATAAKPTAAQRDLGIGMRVLHDEPVIDPGGASVVPFERARITMQPLSLDDMEKLWTGVSMPRLLSVAYEVSVVLIESEKQVRSALPVLTRGPGDPDRIFVQGDIGASIDRVDVGTTKFDEWLRAGSRPGRAAAQIDDTIFIVGQGLAGGAKAIIRPLMHAMKSDTQERALEAEASVNDKGGLTLVLDDFDFAAAEIPAGPCSITLAYEGKDGAAAVTNALPFALAPRIDTMASLPVVPSASGSPFDLAIEFVPPLVEDQSVMLIASGKQFLPTTAPTKGTTKLIFTLDGLGAGTYPVRLRVDGIDSVFVDLDKPHSSSAPAWHMPLTVSP